MSTAIDRVKIMMAKLELDQPSFAALAGTTKSVVNQWLTGKIQSIAPIYAYSISKKSSFCPEWIMLGSGPERTDSKNEEKLPSTATLFKPPSERDTWNDELTTLASQLDLGRLGMLVKEARALRAEMPAKQTPESSQ